MTKKYFLLTAVLLWSCFLFAQDEGVPSLTLQDEQVIAVNKIVEEIKAGIPGYQKKEKFKDASGFRNAFFAGSENRFDGG